MAATDGCSPPIRLEGRPHDVDPHAYRRRVYSRLLPWPWVRRHRDELVCLEKRYRKVIDFADAYIVANAPRRALHVIRDEEGHIVDLLMRCGTTAILATEMQEERRRRQALH